MALQRIAVTALPIGSYVVAVTRQQGDVVVKHAGWVTSAHSITLLRQRGVLEVAIDPARQLQPVVQNNVKPSAMPARPLASISFEQEINRAELVFRQSQQQAELVLSQLILQQQIDFSALNQLSCRLLESTKRNRQALLFLQQVSQQDDALLQHSISCACLMAAFCAHQALEDPLAEQLTMAALLHDVGALQLKLSLSGRPFNDSAAAAASVALLQQQADCPVVLLQSINEHCLGLAQQQSPGGKMLAIVNCYSKLMTKGQKMNSVQAAQWLQQRADRSLDRSLLQQFLRCVGWYSPGCAVRLKSGRIGLVLENHPQHSDKPTVKVFYHSRHRHHLPAKLVDLARQPEERLDACVDLADYQLELHHYC